MRIVQGYTRAALGQGVVIPVEPIYRVDIAGYFVSFQEQGAELVDAINEPNVRLQFDCYPCQAMQGNVFATL